MLLILSAMRTLEENYALLEQLLDEEKVYLVKGLSFARLCRLAGLPRQMLNHHLEKELGMNGEELMETFRRRDAERLEKRYGVRICL